MQAAMVFGRIYTSKAVKGLKRPFCFSLVFATLKETPKVEKTDP